ncbi:hypothetical protein ACHAWF_000742 [Thalassiosira exigua]
MNRKQKRDQRARDARAETTDAVPGGDARNGANAADMLRPKILFRSVLPLLSLLCRLLGNVEVDAMVRAAGLEPPAVSDVEAWVLAKLVSCLTEEIFKQIYGLREAPPRDDPTWQLCREAGREGFERESLGAASTILRGFVGPRLFYWVLPRAIRRANTGLDVQVVSCGPCQVEVSFALRDPESNYEGYDCCVARMGIPRLYPSFGASQPNVCMTLIIQRTDAGTFALTYDILEAVAFKPVHFTSLHPSFYNNHRPFWRVLGSLCMIGVILAVILAKKDFFILQIERSIVLNGILLGVAIEAWHWSLSTHKTQNTDLETMHALLKYHDQRYIDLWRESDQLRRLALDNRNIST